MTSLYIPLLQALKKPLIDAALGFQTMWPNAPSDTVDTSGTFLRFSVVTTAPEGAELGVRTEIISGFIQIDIYTNIEQGDKATHLIVDQLREVYARGRLANGARIKSSGLSNTPLITEASKFKAVFQVNFDYYFVP